MAVARKNEFSAADQRLAEFGKALSHPARLAILKVLAEKEMCICGDLVADLPLAQSTVSQHLKALKEAGLIKGEIDGPRSCYCVDWDAMAQVQKLFERFFSAMQKHKKPVECRP